MRIHMKNKDSKRLSGILLHPTSLPSPYGIGDLGQSAYDFIDFLEKAGQHLWQILPLSPTGAGNSPYSSYSAFAGQTLLISPDHLVKLELLEEWELATCPAVTNEERVDYEAVTKWKNLILKQAFSRFEEKADAELGTEYKQFLKKNSKWLTDYALYMACKDMQEGKEWFEWEEKYRKVDRSTKAELKKLLAEEMKYYYFVQFIFYKEWAELKAYANEKGIMIIGDMPLFVSLDSADVWANPKLFQLNSEGQQTAVAGVPPDYFSEVGQRWGNPLYNWKEHKKRNFKWWVARVSHQLELADYVRIDHFRGLESYWEIPAEEETALNGKWVKAPGKELFETIEKELGEGLPIIAEDLGIITPEVEELRDHFQLPGMKVLQFAFEAEGESTYLPHQLKTPNCVCYSGTHDNNTTQGWYASATEAARDKVRVYMNTDGSSIHRDFIRTCFGSIAMFAIVPMQDALGLGEDGRMNVPGIANGNWNWRYKKDALSDGLAKDLAMLARVYGR
ncbi:MAG: 4-alpha-glucanotransferase [Tyzzerella sp.]|nr:4-alpha-glucanotransferase [Tyzzerella sp.]